MPKAQGRYTNMSIRAAAGERLVKSINWPMFHKQKLTLLHVAEGDIPLVVDPSNASTIARNIRAMEDLRGLLSLMDALQDMAIDVFGIEAADNSQPEEANGSNISAAD